MKLQHVHQEVLILTTSTLSQRGLYGKNSSNGNNADSGKMEEALWGGLLNELVPEIMPSMQHPKIFIWGVHSGECYLLIDLGDSPGIAEPILSIDPHLLLAEVNIN